MLLSVGAVLWLYIFLFCKNAFGNKQCPILCHGQKHTNHGQSGTEAIFAVCYDRSNTHTNFNGGHLMRHFYFRLIFGIVWLIAAVISVVSANIPFAVLYVVLDIVFLWSAHSIWK